MDWTEPAAGILNSVVTDQFLLAVLVWPPVFDSLLLVHVF